MTPEELDQLRRDLGSPQDIRERGERIERILKDVEGREAIWRFVKAVALAFVSIVGLLATLKAIIPTDWYWG